jgi:hypothetical protein
MAWSVNTLQGCDSDTFSNAQVQPIEDGFNQQLNKQLGCKALQHVFGKTFKRVALRS